MRHTKEISVTAFGFNSTSDLEGYPEPKTLVPKFSWGGNETSPRVVWQNVGVPYPPPMVRRMNNEKPEK